MAKSSLVSQIVMFTKSRDNDALLINILSRNFSKLLVVDKITTISTELKEMSPKVIFVSCETMQETLGVYYEALNLAQGGKVCEHCVVAVISRHDEKDAYEAYCSGIIDDYLVARPLYELHRPVLICSHLMKKVGIDDTSKPKVNFLEYKQNYSDAVKEIINKGIERKSRMKKDFEASLVQIDKALDAAAKRIQSHQTVKLDMDMLRQTLSAIKSDEIRPELLKIQNKAIQLLEQVVTEAQNSFSPENMLYSDETLLPELSANNSNISTGSAAKGISSPQAAPLTSPVSTVTENIEHNKPTATAEHKVAIPKVLVIEDDEISLHLTQVLLNKYQLEFDCATTGRRAFACLNSRQYDLVLMDITLPDTNGLYILDQIRNAPNLNKSTPIIMLTGNKNKNTVRLAIEAGAKGYIIKPLHQTSVMKLFEKYQLPLLSHSQ
jgi:CheY-like chemotaxis protein